jgi:hypothetical protein
MKVSTAVTRSRVRYRVIRGFSPRLDCSVLAHRVVACDQVPLHARVFPSRLFLRDVAEEARPGDCGTFVPCQGAVFQHNIESEAPGQRGRQGTRPNEGTALMTVTLMTVTPHLDLPPMFAGSPDQVPCHIRANGTGSRPGRPEELVRVGCFLAAGRSAGIAGQIQAAAGGLDI